jgi:hypothetical protein
VEVADFNQDGIVDLVTANYAGNTVSVLLGRGDGTFQDPRTYATGASPNSVVADDFNGDGFPDVVTADSTDGTVAVLFNDGAWSGGGAGGAAGRFPEVLPLLRAKRNEDPLAAVAVEARLSSIQPTPFKTTDWSLRRINAATTSPQFCHKERNLEWLNGTELTDLLTTFWADQPHEALAAR